MRCNTNIDVKPIEISKIASENQKQLAPMPQSSTRERSEIALVNDKDHLNESFAPALINSSYSMLNFSIDSTVGSDKKLPQSR